MYGKKEKFHKLAITFISKEISLWATIIFMQFETSTYKK